MIEVSEAVRIEIAKLEIKPGDKLVVNIPVTLGTCERQTLRESIARSCGLETSDVLIVFPGVTLEVLSNPCKCQARPGECVKPTA